MSERKPIIPQGSNANPAFAPGVQVGEFLFVSGQAAADNDGNIVGVGDCEAQTRHVMSRVRTVVEAAGATMQDVAQHAVLAAVSNLPEDLASELQIEALLVDRVRAAAFDQDPSLRSCQNPILVEIFSAWPETDIGHALE